MHPVRPIVLVSLVLAATSCKESPVSPSECGSALAAVTATKPILVMHGSGRAQLPAGFSALHYSFLISKKGNDAPTGG